MRVWNAASGEPLYAHIIEHESAVASLAVADLDGRAVIVSGGWDKTVRVRWLANGMALYPPLTDNAGPIFALAAGALDGRA